MECSVRSEAAATRTDRVGARNRRCQHLRIAGEYLWRIANPRGDEADLCVQFAKAAGASVIATTSSEEKGKKLKELGADHVINYKTNPNWGEIARTLTPDNVGVDYIIEVGGSGTLEQSFKCIKLEGFINIIGFVGGTDPQSQPPILSALNNICTVRGILVGSKALMNDMVKAVEVNNIHPVLDPKVFSLEQTKEAFEYMVSSPCSTTFPSFEILTCLM